MKAIVYERFGSADRLRCEEIGTPSPGEGEILVKVRAASVNPLDWHLLRGTPRMIRLSADLRQGKLMRPGRDVAGVVESVGANVARFRPGDAVFGACQGAFADYVCGAESSFTAKPPAVSFEAAAAVPIAGLTALQGLRGGGLRAGQRVLINGAGGGVGTFAVQLAKLDGAEVTAVCSAPAAELVRSLGADRVIDHAERDFVSGGDRYDLILDLVGNHGYRAMKRVLSPAGRIVAVGGGGPNGRRLGRWLGRTLLAVLASRLSSRKVVMCMSKLDLVDLDRLGALIAAGRLRPVIDRRYRLSEVPAAIRHVAEGHAKGKIVISPEG